VVIVPGEPAGAAATDAALIEQSWAEPERFEAIFRRYFAGIHRYLAARVGARIADDPAAEVFTVAFAQRQRYDLAREHARPWLYGIATNLLSNDRRAERRLLLALARLSVSSEPVDVFTGGAADADCDLAAALAKLDSAQRDVLLLHAWAELSYEQIAQALEIPVGTVRSRLSRARATLRADLEPVAATVKTSSAEGNGEVA
jgi:RNA polymerase sigma-70 factor (ECF subfamily)